MFTCALLHNQNLMRSGRKKPCGYIGRIMPRRYCIAIVTLFGLFNVYMMRVDLSVAIEPISCQYHFSESTQGVILSSFFIGYLFNFLGGPLSNKFGAKRVFGTGIFMTAILTLLIPICTSGMKLKALCILFDWSCFFSSILL